MVTLANAPCRHKKATRKALYNNLLLLLLQPDRTLFMFATDCLLICKTCLEASWDFCCVFTIYWTDTKGQSSDDRTGMGRCRPGADGFTHSTVWSSEKPWLRTRGITRVASLCHLSAAAQSGPLLPEAVNDIILAVHVEISTYCPPPLPLRLESLPRHS